MAVLSKNMQNEERLQRILQLRECEQNNVLRMDEVAGIISPKQQLLAAGELRPYRLRERADGVSDETGLQRTGLLSFRTRLFVCLLFFTGYAVFCYTGAKQADTVKAKVKTCILQDYSDKVIDFANDFTYTLDYEKTGTE